MRRMRSFPGREVPYARLHLAVAGKRRDDAGRSVTRRRESPAPARAIRDLAGRERGDSESNGDSTERRKGGGVVVKTSRPNAG